MHVGEWIEWARLAAGLSKRRLAARLGRGPETLKQWTDRVTSPRLSDLDAIASICAVRSPVQFEPAHVPEPSQEEPAFSADDSGPEAAE